VTHETRTIELLLSPTAADELAAAVERVLGALRTLATAPVDENALATDSAGLPERLEAFAGDLEERLRLCDELGAQSESEPDGVDDPTEFAAETHRRVGLAVEVVENLYKLAAARSGVAKIGSESCRQGVSKTITRSAVVVEKLYQTKNRLESALCTLASRCPSIVPDRGNDTATDTATPASDAADGIGLSRMAPGAMAADEDGVGSSTAEPAARSSDGDGIGLSTMAPEARSADSDGVGLSKVAPGASALHANESTRGMTLSKVAPGAGAPGDADDADHAGDADHAAPPANSAAAETGTATEAAAENVGATIAASLASGEFGINDSIFLRSVTPGKPPQTGSTEASNPTPNDAEPSSPEAPASEVGEEETLSEEETQAFLTLLRSRSRRDPFTAPNVATQARVVRVAAEHVTRVRIRALWADRGIVDRPEAAGSRTEAPDLWDIGVSPPRGYANAVVRRPVEIEERASGTGSSRRPRRRRHAKGTCETRFIAASLDAHDRGDAPAECVDALLDAEGGEVTRSTWDAMDEDLLRRSIDAECRRDLAGGLRAGFVDEQLGPFLARPPSADATPQPGRELRLVRMEAEIVRVPALLLRCVAGSHRFRVWLCGEDRRPYWGEVPRQVTPRACALLGAVVAIAVPVGYCIARWLGA